jgi:hypothetical protein
MSIAFVDVTRLISGHKKRAYHNIRGPSFY